MGEPVDQQEDPVVSRQAAIALNHREAGDSFDFHVRHGRALQARAAHETMEMLLTLFRSRRRRPVTPDGGWRVQWPVGPQTSRCSPP